MRKLLSIFIAAALFSSCKKADDGSAKLVYTIADHKVSAPSWGGGSRDCYLAAAEGSSTFEPFCEGIEGFEYAAGSTYVVELKAYKINPPLQDGGDTRYVLSKIISKK